ncbi:MAG TPA: transglutaminase-like domain-containing protein [Kofleriaceae bacterium]|nr:transglutaminase-like domain-containing protein [Kofleriaceae bacterium]
MLRIALVLALLVACEGKAPQPKPPPAQEQKPPAPAPAPAATGPLIEGHLVSAEQVAALAARGTSEQWFGLYFGGKKLGYVRLAMRPPAAGEPGGLVWTVEGTIRTGGPAGASEMKLEEERYYEKTAPYALVQVRNRQKSADGEVERVYRREGAEMVVTQTHDGRAQAERRIPASAETALSFLDQNAVEPGAVKAGMSATVAELDLDAERDEQTTIKVVEVRSQQVSGVDTQVVVLSTLTEGEQTATETVVAAGPVVLTASMGEGVVFRWEEEAVAQSDVVGFDMIADAVRIDRALGEPSAIRELRLAVRVPDSFRLRDAPNQEVERRPDGTLLVSLFSRPGLPVLPGERNAALQPSATIDSTEPTVRALAQEIAGAEPDPAARVAKLIDWTYRNLEKDLSTHIVTASQVAAHRAGDCTEHSILFVALARALGVPAREVSGLIYMGDAVQRFGWHAWAEVELDGRWVAVDPSWGETLANATHLTLGVGDDSDWVATIGSLSISIAD